MASYKYQTRIREKQREYISYSRPLDYLNSFEPMESLHSIKYYHLIIEAPSLVSI